MRRILSIFFIPLFWICLAGYGIIALSVKINPQSIPLLALAGLAFPLVFMIFLSLVFIQGILKNYISFLIGIFVLGITFSTWKPLWGWSKKPIPESFDLKVMNYNVRNFDLYNWSNNEAARERMMKIIQEENPDIICFQEFFSDEGNKLDNIRYLREKLGYKYYYFTRELIKKDTRQWGIATFSKYPIVGKKNILKQQHPSAYGNYPYKGIITKHLIDRDTLNVVNVHLQSVFLEDKDYETLKKLTEEKIIDIEDNMSLIKKILAAHKRRAVQIEDLFLETSTYEKKTIISGDFNDTPISYTYKKMTKDYKDVFPSTGSGWGATYNRFYPGLRIDFILLSNDLKPLKTKTIRDKTSDHFPLVSYINVN